MIPMGTPKPSGVEPGEYVYVTGFPKECHGHLYRVLYDVLDVPTYQQKLLVEALTGEDKGLFFVCTIANFKARYRRASWEEVERYKVGRWCGDVTPVSAAG